jgi:hemoglobin/transferrin/lactoferrin receptor protein
LFGIYLQDQIDVADRLHVYAGTRYTRADADVGRYQDPVTKEAASFSDDWDQWVASGRFVFDLDEKDRFAVIGGVSQGFRAPNISDLSRLDIARSGELELAATDLKPERSLNFEIGARATTERVTASLTYFHNVLDDFIVRRPTGQEVDGARAVSKANGGDGYVQGVEFAADVRLTDNWSVFGQLTWMEGELDQFPTSASVMVTEPLSRVVPLMGRAGVRWQSDSGKIWSELVCLAASAGDRLNSADRADTQRILVGGTPGWTLLLLRGGWQVTENVSLTASLENLLDEEYRAHGSGSNAPGFGGTAAWTVRF